MARLQILQLPEGVGDSRPPFILVVDQYVARRYITGLDQAEPVDEFDRAAEKIGARAVLVFEETIDIPANDLDDYSGIPGGDYTTFAETVQRTLGIDTSTATPDVAGWLLTACRELEKSQSAREQLRQERDAQVNAIQRALALHRPVEYNGQIICWECSAYDFQSQSTDNAPVAHDQCGTFKALNGQQAQP
ncbi:hypothetical protein OG411_29985 [Streptomyces pseudogriseolus]|uniref:hypothetical protein n=1 Tax=Streptomyces pseudogriseolus TaxID=36817 RepID=UPI00324B8A17